MPTLCTKFQASQNHCETLSKNKIKQSKTEQTKNKPKNQNIDLRWTWRTLCGEFVKWCPETFKKNQTIGVGQYHLYQTIILNVLSYIHLKYIKTNLAVCSGFLIATYDYYKPNSTQYLEKIWSLFG